ncbi:N-acetylmuramic acid 6-phosphate etherase [Leucoagaricus sp. SymC.cos]|nr:N-acetylmuramic acid 6-phosphate etherase [Leucoagaricus sp. SymC.cos]
MSNLRTTSQLANLQTECRNVLSSNIDVVSTFEMCRIMNAEDSQVAGAVGSCLEDISIAIDLVAERVKENGRVIYFGAGTSGRLGVLDASEIPPTFSASFSQFIGIMAGGDTAIRRAVEGAEDSFDGAMRDLEALDPPLSKSDVAIGIASSGRTPYVLGGLSYAKDLGAFSVGICCVKPRPEIVTGSTRMKAGTATKLILNMISTGTMIRIGKTYGNLMVDVNPSNFKLEDRARRIFRTVLPDTTLSDSQIDDLLASCHQNVKCALVADKFQCTASEASHLLEAVGGVLKRALQVPAAFSAVTDGQPDDFVLCIDAGGTKCKAVIANKSGVICRGEGGPCNFVTLGHDAALAALSKAVTSALSQLPAGSSVAPVLPPSESIFSAAWIGGAGLDRTADLTSIRRRIVTLLNISDPQHLIVTNDAALLSSAIVTQPKSTGIKSGIVLIAGTGALAYSYTLSGKGQSSLPRPVNRSSGWGYLLGDEGSAFAIGRDAVRSALDQHDRGLATTRLHLAIMKYFGCASIGELISAIYLGAPPTLKEGQDPSSAESDPKLRIAGVCRTVFDHAFPSRIGNDPDTEALQIIRKHATSAAQAIIRLLASDSDIHAAQSVLVFGGALGQVGGYREMIVDTLKASGHWFARLESVSDAANAGIEVLIQDYLI